MDKKKKIGKGLLLAVGIFALTVLPLQAQNPERIQFCAYECPQESDTITLFFNLIDVDGSHLTDLNIGSLYEHLRLVESGHEIRSGEFRRASGIRIPKEQTISVLVDRGIDRNGKEQIYEAIGDLVNSAPDSCIYLSFFDDEVTKAKLVTKSNYRDFSAEFNRESAQRFFYNALYYKLKEFNAGSGGLEADDYNPEIVRRANAHNDKNAMFVFIDGHETDDFRGPIQVGTLTREAGAMSIKPTIYAFYYVIGNDLDGDLRETLQNVTGESDMMNFPRGKYVSSDNRDEILKEIGEAQKALEYDFAFSYKAFDKSYQGKETFSAKWDGSPMAKEAEFSIGTPENPWPRRPETGADIFLKFCVALLATFLTIAFFFAIMKILIPFIKSKTFSAKYYKKYEPEYGIQKRICCYCKQPIIPGQPVVAKCEHVMHVHCWEENDYRCAEYGQNCKTGIQEHVCWDELFTKASFRDCHQAISGILAGLFGWIVYELMGRGAFPGVAEGITNTFLTVGEKTSMLHGLCVSKVQSFLAIGMLLGFFLSLLFRYNEEYRKKNATIYFKIIALSLLSGLIGWLAFAVGGIILCMFALSLTTPVIPWYCSLPAYLLFSVCAALSLTIKTSIPIKSAMLGGLLSAVIGFLVLYFSNIAANSHPWMNMLLDFIIYGGGLGASLVTVRMLAEKYFLVIQNGPKAGTRIPIHKWMNATGGGNKVTIGMTGDCEIQMNWEKTNKVAKEHAVLYIDQAKSLPMIKPLAQGVIYNSRATLPAKRPGPLINGDTFQIGDTIFLYEETD